MASAKSKMPSTVVAAPPPGYPTGGTPSSVDASPPGYPKEGEEGNRDGNVVPKELEGKQRSDEAKERGLGLGFYVGRKPPLRAHHRPPSAYKYPYGDPSQSQHPPRYPRPQQNPYGVNDGYEYTYNAYHGYGYAYNNENEEEEEEYESIYQKPSGVGRVPSYVKPAANTYGYNQGFQTGYKKKPPPIGMVAPPPYDYPYDLPSY